MRPTLDRILCGFFFLLGIALLAAAGYCYFAPTPGPMLAASETEIEIADAYAEKSREVTFRLTNSSRVPIRVCGLADC